MKNHVGVQGDKAFGRSLLSSAVLAALAGMAQAQTAAPTPAAAVPPAGAASVPRADRPGVEMLDAVIVTGTAGREGKRKLDASFSITTANEEQIKQAAPSSTADLLKIVPGVFVETTGGQSGANMRVRGFPTPGDGPYSTFELNGSPLFALPTLSFFEHSQLFRLDDTIDRVEVLRGGPNPIFGSGQPGVTVNFIQKQGSSEPEGSLRVTTGTGNLRRFDGVYAGPLGDKWRLMVGGFYRTSDGLRNTEFPADQGGQFSAMLSRSLDDGQLSMYARVMNEKNAFYTAIPVVSSADGKSVTGFPGFDPLRAYYYGNELRNMVLESGRCEGEVVAGVARCVAGSLQRETVERDLADGRGANVRTYGATIDKKLGDWSLQNKTGYTAGSVPTYALFSGNNPTTLQQYIIDTAGRPTATGTANFVNGGAAITDQSLPVVVNGMWVVDKELRSFTNESRLSRELGKQHTLTLGLYLADYSSHDRWYLGQAQLMTVEPHARLIDVVLDNGNRVTRNGAAPPPFSFNLDGKYNGNTTALYLADEWKASEKLRVDGGIRFERQRISGTIANVLNTDIDGDATTLWNNNLAVFDGTTRSITSSLSRTSVTAGANYKFSPEFSMFGRVNNGHRMPDFDVLRGRGANETLPSVEDIAQVEIGLKTVTPLYTAFLTAYHARLKNSQTQQFTNAGNQVQRPNSRTTGIEFEAALRPLKGLELALTGNLQQAKYFDFPGFEGNTIERQPKLQFRFTPSYRIPTSIGSVNVYATWTHVGERFASQANTLKLPKYDTLDAGIVAHLNNGIDIRLTGTNLTNKIGLTEGNFRVPNQAVGSDGVFLARPLFARAFELSLGFAF